MPARELPGYSCPVCGEQQLAPRGGPSLLDKRYRWECRACRTALGSDRPTALLLVYLFVSVLATAASWTFLAGVVLFVQAGAPLPAQQLEAAPPHKLLKALFYIVLILMGVVAGPLAIVMVIRDLLAKRPTRSPPARVADRDLTPAVPPSLPFDDESDLFVASRSRLRMINAAVLFAVVGAVCVFLLWDGWGQQPAPALPFRLGVRLSVMAAIVGVLSLLAVPLMVAKALFSHPQTLRVSRGGVRVVRGPECVLRIPFANVAEVRVVSSTKAKILSITIAVHNPEDPNTTAVGAFRGAKPGQYTLSDEYDVDARSIQREIASRWQHTRPPSR